MLTLVFVSREAGVKFFRFNTGLAAVLVGVALAYRPSGGDGVAANAALFALLLAEAATIGYWATVGRGFASIRPILVAAGVGGGIAVLILQAVAIAAGRSMPMILLTIAPILLIYPLILRYFTKGTMTGALKG